MNKKNPRDHQIAALEWIRNNPICTINLPTGSGKSLIQSRAIMEDVEKSSMPKKVYVILAPRILLVSQLFSDLKVDFAQSGIDAQYLIVNSGGRSDKSDMDWFKSTMMIEKENGIPYREVPSTTSPEVIKETYNKAQRQNVPLVIIGNYHSANKIKKSGIPVFQLHADEAHYLVPGNDHENNFSNIVNFPSDNKIFYTATMKFTKGKLGMNTPTRFGKIFSRLPVELINAGEMLRPRMHFVVNIEQKNNMTVVDKDAVAIENAFKRHSQELKEHGLKNIGTKIIVVAKGSDHLDNLVKHPNLINLRDKNVKIFDITSANGARINGETVTREYFLKELRNMKDEDEAIILHVRILTEGIDVSGITGIMPLNNLKKSSFLQTLGRATRLHPEDRKRLYDKTMLPEELKKFIKPYAWIIIPIYDDLGAEMNASFSEIVLELRTFGFKPCEDIIISDGPTGPGWPTGPKPPKPPIDLKEIIAKVEQEFEKEDKANKIEKETDELRKRIGLPPIFLIRE